MRLDKFLSNNTSASRSEVRRLVKAKGVRVNGTLVNNTAMQIALSDQVELNDVPVVNVGRQYFMLYKPTGYISANQDGSYPTVLDLLAQRSNNATGKGQISPRAQELQIVGRLDLDTTGLVLITNDGHWNHRVTSPSSNCKKVYAVTLAQTFDPNTRDAFDKGMQLDGEKKPTLPASLEQLDGTHLRVTIQEGKYHQVKRMFAATGNRVIALHRIAIGQIELDPALQPGQFRPLTEDEINSIGRGGLSGEGTQ
jgi:16S rRNA pseudouridine516 synthase